MRPSDWAKSMYGGLSTVTKKVGRCGEVEVRSTVVRGALPLSCGRLVGANPTKSRKCWFGNGLDSYGRVKTD